MTNNAFTKRWGTLLLVSALFICSFQLRWWYIQGTSMIQPVRADAALYTTIAYDLARDGKYYTKKYSPEIQKQLNSRDPGYPFFLSVIARVNSSLTGFFYTTTFVQALLDSCTVIMSFFISGFFLPPLWCGVVSLLTAFSPHLISMTNYILTETLFTFLLTAAILSYLYCIKKRNLWFALLSGLIFSYAMCVRSVLQLFPLILIAIILFYFRDEWKFAIRSTSILLLASCIFFVPWQVYAHKHKPDAGNPSSLLGEVLYVGSYIGLVSDEENKKMYGEGMPYRSDQDFEAIVDGGYYRILMEIAQRFKEKPIENLSWYLFGKPNMFWRWTMIHSGGEFNVYPYNWTWYDKNRIMNMSKELMWFLHPILVFCMHVGIIIFIIRRKQYYKSQKIIMSTLIMLMFYFLFIHTITVPVPRYSLPLRPLLYFLAVYCLAELSNKTITIQRNNTATVT